MAGHDCQPWFLRRTSSAPEEAGRVKSAANMSRRAWRPVVERDMLAQHSAARDQHEKHEWMMQPGRKPTVCVCVPVEHSTGKPWPGEPKRCPGGPSGVHGTHAGPGGPTRCPSDESSQVSGASGRGSSAPYHPPLPGYASVRIVWSTDTREANAGAGGERKARVHVL
eukprot:Tamp_29571.p1 GENE.Tamp_29571~~Tamp_29571.p1  ORF type:complete len:179 (+),score=10.08 Tamp_29571:39-539(+)